MILTVQNVYNAPFEKWNLFFAHTSGYLFGSLEIAYTTAVSYTHLTLPTIA